MPSLLSSLGYKRAPVVSDKGEFAVRGGIIDIFPTAATEPYRLDFFGDTLEEIRTFDPVGQRSLNKVESLFICPASEWLELKKESAPALLWDYLPEDTAIIFSDILAVEDHYASLTRLTASASPLFSTMPELMSRVRERQKIFFSEQPIEALSDVSLQQKKGRDFYSGKDPLQKLSFSIFDTTFSTERWMHPFVEISYFFSAE
jgi:transcription-repair coupling factor (superfamily II helicase)